MKLSRLKNVPCLIWCLGLNAVLLAAWAVATPTFLDAENSPHRVYRLEFHKASFLQRITHPRFKMPYVELQAVSNPRPCWVRVKWSISG